MTRIKGKAVTVVLVIIVAIIGLAVGALIHVPGASPVVQQPGTHPHVTPTHAPSAGTPDASLTGPLTLPNGLHIDGYDVDQTTAKQWVTALLRSDRVRWAAVAKGDAGLEADVLSGQGYDGQMGPLLGSGNGKPATVTGAPTYTYAEVRHLSADEEQMLASLGMQDQAGYAILLVEKGPVTVTPAGGTAQTVVPAADTEVIFAGQFVQDPRLGEIWQSALITSCPAGDSLSIAACTY